MSDDTADNIGTAEEWRALARGQRRVILQQDEALAASESARANLEAVITEAPHDERCAHFSYTHPRPDCDCWKSRVGDPVMLREHDAKVLREYADALEANRSAEVWDKDDFVRDVREWASYRTENE